LSSEAIKRAMPVTTIAQMAPDLVADEIGAESFDPGPSVRRVDDAGTDPAWPNPAGTSTASAVWWAVAPTVRSEVSDS
jgi:hypothetical protein